MGAYLDRLNAEFDEITGGITAILERAADEGRDVSEQENEQIGREDKRRDELTRAIEHHTALDERTSKVLEARSRVRPPAPTLLRTKPEAEPYSIEREFPTAGHYAMTLHNAVVHRDAESIAKIERATANQTTADNPGLIPRPLVGPLLGTLPPMRPLLGSIPNRAASAPVFDRPKITQHVDVAKQTAEKTLTASRQMTIGKVSVTLDTYAGHVNVSRQDLRWTQPSILQVLFSDFTSIYAQQTDTAACAEFPGAITQSAAMALWDYATVQGFLRGAVATIAAQANGAVPDTLWMSSDVWTKLGGVMTSATSGVPAYNLPLTGGGDIAGLRPVLDAHLAANTLIVGASALAEVWEDLDGFLTVDEPDLLGQLVGYAGYMDFVVVEPKGFVKATGLTAEEPSSSGTASGSKR
jgi:HK97 family phage major capsid protein